MTVDRLGALEAALREIGKRARSNGLRTFDSCIDDLVWIDDECRRLAALDAASPLTASAVEWHPREDAPDDDREIIGYQPIIGREDAAASEARAAERERLGFGKIVMMSEQRNRPGQPPRWCALARGSKVAAMGDSEEEARLLAIAPPAQPET